MNPVLARLLTRLYPRHWRERYGAEFEAFLQTGQGGLHTSMNVVWSALWEHVVPSQGGNMDPNPNSFRAILKHPSSFLPLAMSLTAIGVLCGAAIYGILHGAHGIIRQPDEGSARRRVAVRGALAGEVRQKHKAAGSGLRLARLAYERLEARLAE